MAEDQSGQTRIFKFRVDSDGRFHFDPPGEWAYGHQDVVRFQCETGPFSMAGVPIAGNDYYLNPLGFPLQSDPQDGAYTFHAAETKVNDPWPEEKRKTIQKANMGPKHPDGFVGRFRYVIFVTRDGKQFISDEKNGVYAC